MKGTLERHPSIIYIAEYQAIAENARVIPFPENARIIPFPENARIIPFPENARVIPHSQKTPASFLQKS